MELDAVERQLPVAYRHHLVVAGGADLEAVRDGERCEGVVAARLEVLR